MSGSSSPSQAFIIPVLHLGPGEGYGVDSIPPTGTIESSPGTTAEPGSGGAGASGSGGASGGNSGGGGDPGGGPGGGDPGGGSNGSNCHAEGSLVLMADGSSRPIETLVRGDRVLAIDIDGLKRDRADHVQFEWLRENAKWRETEAEVASVTLGEHDGLVIVNYGMRLTEDHPVLVRRGREHGFISAGLLKVGDRLVQRGGETVVSRLGRETCRHRTVSIYVPGVNTYFADGVCCHNATFIQSSSGPFEGSFQTGELTNLFPDSTTSGTPTTQTPSAPATTSGGSAPGSGPGGSSGGSSGGGTSGGGITLSQQPSGSGSSGAATTSGGTKTMGSSFASSSSSSGSPSGSGSGSGGSGSASGSGQASSSGSGTASP